MSETRKPGEAEIEEPTAEQQATAVEADLDELTEAKRERDEYLELAQRTRADFENYRKRASKDASDAAARGKAELAAKLIPAVDNLERALLAEGVDPNSKQEVEGLIAGVLLVYRELREVLEAAGVEPYDPAGEQFDPAWHEALQTRVEEGTEAGKVLETVEKGYRLDGQVLRAARVVVSA
jgi:molecular chaperone GrpE